MKIKFLGAIGEVTGSSYLLTGDDGSQVLIDLGMFQGRLEVTRLNHEPLAFEVAKLSGVVLTHAHLDHCGRLPLLVRAGYAGPVYMTEATADLVALSLRDAAKVALENQVQRGDVPMFLEDDVIRLLNLIKPVRYGVEVKIGQLTAIFHDAGHILGSSSIEFRTKVPGQRALPEKEEVSIVFSGDLGNSPQDLIMPTEPIKGADYVVMESTYGNRLHTLENPTDIIGQEINEVEKTGGTLLIPAFSLERTQEILHRIDHLKKSGRVKQETAIFLDSPLGVTATEVFKKHTELYNAELAHHVKLDDPFEFPGLVVVEEAWQSKKIKDQDRAKVIIAGSGMMTGGRIMQHAIDFLPIEKTRVLIVGYMAEDTLGRKLVDGEKNVFIDKVPVEVKANIRVTTVMSAHADQVKLLEWLKKIKGVKKVFLTHGEEEERQVLAEKIKETLAFPEVYLPKLNEEVEL